jgi:hypothetical protein
MDASQAALWELTGNEAMFVFQTLSAGNRGQFGAPGSGVLWAAGLAPAGALVPAPTTAIVTAATAAMDQKIPPCLRVRSRSIVTVSSLPPAHPTARNLTLPRATGTDHHRYLEDDRVRPVDTRARNGQTRSVLALHILSFLVGLLIVGLVLASALKTVVLPRVGFTRIARLTFSVTHRLMIHGWGGDIRRASRISLFAPVALVSLPLVWMISVTVGFAFIFYGVEAGTFTQSVTLSGSSLFTLGFAKPTGAGRDWITFVEATIGLGLVALLISYLPTIYGAYNGREKGVKLLHPFAGTPASSVELLERLERAQFTSDSTVWTSCSNWLVDLQQSHTSFPALCYFPMMEDGQSWVCSAGAVLDASAILIGSLDFSDEALRGPLFTLAFGSPALVRIARTAGLPVAAPMEIATLLDHVHEAPPAISVRRQEYEACIDQLAAAGIPRAADPDSAWRVYAWVRSTYDDALRGLAGLTDAPSATLTTDRPAKVGRPRMFGNGPLRVDWDTSVPDRR